MLLPHGSCQVSSQEVSLRLGSVGNLMHLSSPIIRSQQQQEEELPRGRVVLLLTKILNLYYNPKGSEFVVK